MLYRTVCFVELLGRADDGFPKRYVVADTFGEPLGDAEVANLSAGVAATALLMISQVCEVVQDRRVCRELDGVRFAFLLRHACGLSRNGCHSCFTTDGIVCTPETRRENQLFWVCAALDRNLVMRGLEARRKRGNQAGYAPNPHLWDSAKLAARADDISKLLGDILDLDEEDTGFGADMDTLFPGHTPAAP